jgi:hypothetical protein
MSLYLPDPVPPGTVAQAQLGKVRELHAAVRDWIERSAVAQKNEHLRANLPYADLMFALGFATLGDHATANRLVEDARKVMEVPIPKGGNPPSDLYVIAAVVSIFLFRALHSRVEQALAGKQHGGSLSREVLAGLDDINRVAAAGPVNSPYNLAVFSINRFRRELLLLEPIERVDPYTQWSKHTDLLKRELEHLHSLWEPDVLAGRIRGLYQSGIGGKELAEVQFAVLNESLSLASRLKPGFAAELLDWVPGVLAAGPGAELSRDAGASAWRQGELLTRAFSLATDLGLHGSVTKLVDSYTSLLETGPNDARAALIHHALGPCVLSLRSAGLRQETERLVEVLHRTMFRGVPLREWHRRQGDWNDQSERAAALVAGLGMASGWLFAGKPDLGQPAFAAALAELEDEQSRFQSQCYSDIARAYATAAGQTSAGLELLVDLFRRLHTLRISNTFTTAQFYSRLHLQVTEDVVFAACRFCLDNPVPVTATA